MHAADENGVIMGKKGDYNIKFKANGQVELEFICRKCKKLNRYLVDLGKSKVRGYEIKVLYQE
ncbi:MAG: hypothetical protein DRP08_02240 [Candidatus Aenigmatarchaeota archaeon]|nr:MAG: hypothetical protein DRP08_02240 [Candidatus Aenigmarchaeota archaeon]